MQITPVRVGGSLFRAAAANMVFVSTVVQKNAARPGNRKLVALEVMPQILFGQCRLHLRGPGTNFLRLTSSCKGLAAVKAFTQIGWGFFSFQFHIIEQQAEG